MLENVNLSVTAPAEENSGDVSGGDVEGVRGVLDQLFGACVEDLLTGDDSVFQTTGESAYNTCRSTVDSFFKTLFY